MLKNSIGSECKAPIDQSMSYSTYTHQNAPPKAYGSLDASIYNVDFSGKHWIEMPEDILITTAQYTLKRPQSQSMDTVDEAELFDLLNSRENLDIKFPMYYCGKYGCMPIDFIYCGSTIECFDSCMCRYGANFKCEPNPASPRRSLHNECYSCWSECGADFCCTIPAGLVMLVPTIIASCFGFVIDAGCQISKCFNKKPYEKKMHSFFGPKPQDIISNGLEETKQLLPSPRK